MIITNTCVAEIELAEFAVDLKGFPNNFGEPKGVKTQIAPYEMRGKMYGMRGESYEMRGEMCEMRGKSKELTRILLGKQRQCNHEENEIWRNTRSATVILRDAHTEKEK